jgi:hypothetical protein
MYVDFYLSSQGPRIVFLLRSTHDRDWLLGLFRDLANHRVSKFALRQIEWTEFSTNCPSILLKLVKNEGSQQIVYENTDSDGKVLAWSRHDEGWLECAEKIAALAKSGHQHMGNGEAEIEVSFLEDLKNR